MPPSISPQEFVHRWRAAEQKERSTAQSHFIDLCALIGHPTPIEADPRGEWFAFEVGANKTTGGDGFADVWKKGYFAWEYKGKHADMGKAYEQLLKYRESLQNPPLLVVCDINQIIVHTNFTNTVKRIVTITLDDLLTPKGMSDLRAIFNEPEYFRSEQTTAQVTQTAAEKFGDLAELLRNKGGDPERIAHFLIRLLFCLFAEDIDLLPQRLFTRMVQQWRNNPTQFSRVLVQLFEAMASGGSFGIDPIRHFNGGLFDDGSVLELGYAGLTILQDIAALDWGSIEPSILGTLFERSLDPSKRSQLGAHYTSRDDILLLVEPVLMAPLRREWAEVRATLEAEVARREADIASWIGRTDRSATARSTQIQSIRTASTGRVTGLILPFLQGIRSIRVLDPACGSGNFLYMSLRQLLDLEKEVINAGALSGIPGLFPEVNPAQLYGIELNEYAHELAQATVWIGWIQWLHENGYGVPREPILKRLDNIRQMDAILDFDADGKPVEPEWPDAEVIVGNPPFLGVQKLRTELGDKSVDLIFSLYKGRVPATADLVCYWFERSRQQIATGKTSRAGLLATQSIRSGRNRSVLERIKQTGDIFLAWSDRPWVLDGAAVRVSMIGFDGRYELNKHLDGQQVANINPNLTANLDVNLANRLSENNGLGFEGIKKNGPFEITDRQAQQMLSQVGNPNGRPNSDVIKRWINGQDITGRTDPYWLIDFGIDTPLEVAAEYEKPFAYVEQKVKPIRSKSRDKNLKAIWWLFERPRPAMQAALKGLSRFIVTPRVAKHRVFEWVDAGIIPDGRLNVFARADDYFFGVLHSHFHEVWALANAPRHGDGDDGGRPTYNNRTAFETFPFPWPPGQEPPNEPRVQAIAVAAQELVIKRKNSLNPMGITDPTKLATLTLTNLYNDRPMWLNLAHKKLDAAVAAAYGWPADLGDEEILARLLALNLDRAKRR